LARALLCSAICSNLHAKIPALQLSSVPGSLYSLRRFRVIPKRSTCDATLRTLRTNSYKTWRYSHSVTQYPIAKTKLGPMTLHTASYGFRMHLQIYNTCKHDHCSRQSEVPNSSTSEQKRSLANTPLDGPTSRQIWTAWRKLAEQR